MPEQFYLSEEDRSKIVESVLRTMTDRYNAPTYFNDGLGYEFPTMSPEVYICKGAVPKRKCKKCGPVGSGSDAEKKWIPGSAQLPIWKLEYDDTCGWYLEKVTYPNGTQKTLEVFNVRACEVVDDFNICKRDKFGRWHIEYNPCEPDCSSSSSSSGSDSISGSGLSEGSSVGSESGSKSGSGGSESGSVSGSAGSISGSVTGSVSGSLLGSVSGSVSGSLSTGASGSISGSQGVSGSVSGSVGVSGSFSGSFVPSVGSGLSTSVGVSVFGSVPNDCIDVVTDVSFDSVSCELSVTKVTICCVCVGGGGKGSI